MPTPLTVTATCAGARFALTVRVLTSAAGVGAVINNGGTTCAITPQASGSLVYGIGYFYGGHPSAIYYDPLNAATTIINDAWGSNTGQAVAFRSASPTTASVPVTLGVVATGGESFPDVALAEILSAGALAEDASSPPPLPGPAPQNPNLNIATTLTTATFSPPGGALIVALAAAQNTAAITLSDSSGLTWTQAETIALTVGRASVWTAPIPGGGGGGPAMLSRYVLTQTVTVPAGTPAVPVAFEPATGGAAGFGNTATSAGIGYFPQTFLAGQVIVADPACPLYAAIGAGNLRPYQQGQDDVGHAALSN